VRLLSFAPIVESNPVLLCTAVTERHINIQNRHALVTPALRRQL